MEKIAKILKLPKKEYYETHLSLINCLLPVKLTPMELQVIAAFMGLEGHIAQYRFGPSAKKIVREELKISQAGMSNYLGQLLEKGFLVKRGDMINILPILIPEDEVQLYYFKLEKLESNGTLSTNTE